MSGNGIKALQLCEMFHLVHLPAQKKKHTYIKEVCFEMSGQADLAKSNMRVLKLVYFE